MHFALWTNLCRFILIEEVVPSIHGSEEQLLAPFPVLDPCCNIRCIRPLARLLLLFHSLGRKCVKKLALPSAKLPDDWLIEGRKGVRSRALAFTIDQHFHSLLLQKKKITFQFYASKKLLNPTRDDDCSPSSSSGTKFTLKVCPKPKNHLAPVMYTNGTVLYSIWRMTSNSNTQLTLQVMTGFASYFFHSHRMAGNEKNQLFNLSPYFLYSVCFLFI